MPEGYEVGLVQLLVNSATFNSGQIVWQEPTLKKMDFQIEKLVFWIKKVEISNLKFRPKTGNFNKNWNF